MIEYIRSVTDKHLRCFPSMDRHSNSQLHRITGKRLPKKTVEVPWELVTLPDNINKYHLFILTQMPFDFIGIEDGGHKWHRLPELATKHSNRIEVFTKSSKLVPGPLVYIKRSESRTIYVAIRDHGNSPYLLNTEVFLGVYRNSFIGSTRNEGGDLINHRGIIVETPDEATVFFNEFLTERDLGYNIDLFVNGVYINSDSPTNWIEGTIVEYISDKSVKEVVTFNVKDLPTFYSEMDEVTKYLIYRNKVLKEDGSVDLGIDYIDDLDFILYNDVNEVRRLGIKFHVLERHHGRMLLPKCYSLSLDAIDYAVLCNEDFLQQSGLKLQIRIRNSGIEKEVGLVSQQIKELYRLDDKGILDVLVGLRGYVEGWRASDLEQSLLNQYISSPNPMLDMEVYDVLGNDVVQKTIGDCYLKVDSQDPSTVLPVGFHQEATVCEYTSNGVLLSLTNQFNDHTYSPLNEECDFIVAYREKSTMVPNIVINVPRSTIDPNKRYGFYVGLVNKESEVADGWRLAVEGQDYVITDKFEDSIMVDWFNIDYRLYETMVIPEDDAILFEGTIDRSDGLLQLELTTNVIFNGELENKPLPLDWNYNQVWLNSRPLIPVVDFTIKNSVLTITNKTCLVEGEQSIIVRCSGLPNLEGSTHRQEISYVAHGILSKNDSFDLRKDKVFTINVGNRIIHPDELVFSEDDTGVRISNVPDGTPYVVDYIDVPLWELEYLAKDNVKAVNDEVVSTWFNDLFPDKEVSEPILLVQPHELYSPFITDLINRIREGDITIVKERITDVMLDGYVYKSKPYLDVDPVTFGLDRRLVKIHPHPYTHTVTVNVHEYSFLDRVIGLYCDGKVNLNQFVTVVHENY